MKSEKKNTVKMTPRFLFGSWKGHPLGWEGCGWDELGGRGQGAEGHFGEASVRCLLDIKKKCLIGNWVYKPTTWMKNTGQGYRWSPSGSGNWQ